MPPIDVDDEPAITSSNKQPHPNQNNIEIAKKNKKQKTAKTTQVVPISLLDDDDEDMVRSIP